MQASTDSYRWAGLQLLYLKLIGNDLLRCPTVYRFCKAYISTIIFNFLEHHPTHTKRWMPDIIVANVRRKRLLKQTVQNVDILLARIVILCIYRELITNEMLNTNNCRYTLRD
jgi:hypothetical protein